MNKLINEEQFDELFKFASKEGTEWGDGVEPLCTMYHCAQYLSDEFFEAYRKELQDKYDFMIENTILETTEERVIFHEVTERIWND